eukprot:scaffold28788_cov130-Amphora_coffeaeformis.AAC.1
MKTALEGLGTKAKGKFGDELGGRVINAADRSVASQWLNFFGRFQSPGHETPLASGVSTNVSVDVDTRQHDSEADVDARQHDPGQDQDQPA